MKTVALAVFLTIIGVTLVGCGTKATSNNGATTVNTPPPPPSVGANATTAP